MAHDVPALDRAFALASSGDYTNWPAIADQLAKECYAAKLIARIGRDQETQRELAVLVLDARKAREVPEHDLAGAKRFSPSLPVTAFMSRRCT